jgi:formamidopyrimidine-DNA glycosylase
MIELPEAVVISQQITQTLGGKRIAHAVANASPHKFAWYTGNPVEYNNRLAGKTVSSAQAVGGNIETIAGDMILSISAPIKYHAAVEKRPKKHQVLVEFEDGTAISSCAQMWGGFFCFPVGTKAGFPDADIARARPSPLTEAFDRAYFDSLFNAETPELSAKAFLATKQRIPGLGNGVLQDILWVARIHPKRKMGDLAPKDIDQMFVAVKSVLREMAAKGGRDTERDLFDHPGGYKTILSKNTVGKPCPACGTIILKEPYMGGSIYVCEGCQKL